jgi:serine/threonine protein kinase
MVAFNCIHCHSMLKVETQGPGQKVKCPRCMNVVLVPNSVPETAPVVGGSGGSLSQIALDDGRSESPSPSLQDTVAGVAPSSGGEVASMLAPARGPGELGWLGPYRVLKILGHGGMGVVFHAEDPQLGRDVAIKAILPRYARNPNARHRFIREARAAAGLKHDNIVAIYQVGEDRGIPYQAMEYLQGQSLERYLLRKQQVPAAEVLRIGRDIANGLAEAHSRGLIHRDIKPANIWLEKKKETAAGLATVRVKILDFGLARDAREDTSITQLGTIVGTPAYMAPEQAKGHPVDHRSDLFSLGCLLYRLSTGKLPFDGDNTLAILTALATETPPPPYTLGDMPEQASDFIMTLLEKDPEQRPESARETAETLSRLLRDLKKGAKADARPAQPARPAPKWHWNPRWGRWWWWAAGAGAMLLVAILAALPWGGEPVEPKNGGVKEPTPKPPPKIAPTITPAEVTDDSLLGRFKHDAIPADDLTWAFGSARVPREVAGIIRNRSVALGDARLGGFALSPDERWLAFGGLGLQVESRDFATGKSHLGSRAPGALAYYFNLGKSSLVTGNADGSVTNRNLLTHQETVLLSPAAGASATTFGGAPDSPFFFMGTADGKILYLTPLAAKKHDFVSAYAGPVAGLLYRPENRKLISAGADGAIIQWSSVPGKDNPRALPKTPDRFIDSLLPSDHGKFRHFSFGPDNTTLLVAFEDSKAIHRINLDKRAAMSPFQVDDDIASFSLAPDKSLATISPRGHLRVWSYTQERRLAEVALPPLGDDSYGPIQFAPDGRHLLVGHPRGAVILVRMF